jgi:ABC-type phosphate transport system auxiliary subunit
MIRLDLMSFPCIDAKNAAKTVVMLQRALRTVDHIYMELDQAHQTSMLSIHLEKQRLRKSQIDRILFGEAST